MFSMRPHQSSGLRYSSGPLQYYVVRRSTRRVIHSLPAHSTKSTPATEVESVAVAREVMRTSDRFEIVLFVVLVHFGVFARY